MEIKNFLSELEEQLTTMDEEDNELSGRYILFVGRQGFIQAIANCTGEFIATSIVELFENLHEADKEAAAKVLALLCMQVLEESQEGVEH